MDNIPIKISLFGKMQICSGENSTNIIDTRRNQEVLAYLLLYRSKPHSREKLADLLWNGSVQSRKYLRQALWQLHNALDAVGAGDLLLFDNEWVQCNPQAQYWLDVAILEECYNLVREVPGQQLDEQMAETIKEVLKLYQGELLDGWYQDWCIFERENCENMYLALLHKMMIYCEKQQTYEMGIAYGQDILRWMPAYEHAHYQLMRLYYLAGNRSAALYQYHHCRSILNAELDVEPSHQTQALYQQIKEDNVNDGPGAPRISRLTPRLLRETVTHINQLQAAMSDLKLKSE
jgi:DNA-binding SARP family transcriptional activator